MDLKGGEIISLCYLSFADAWLNGIGGALTCTDVDRNSPGVFFRLESQVDRNNFRLCCMYAPADDYSWLAGETRENKVYLQNTNTGYTVIWNIQPLGHGNYRLACTVDQTLSHYMEVSVVPGAYPKVYLSTDVAHAGWGISRFVSLNDTGAQQLSGNVVQLWQKPASGTAYCLASDPLGNRVFPSIEVAQTPPIRQFWTVNMVSDSVYTIKAFQRGPDAYLYGDLNTLQVGLVEDPSGVPGAYWRQTRSNGFKWTCGDSDKSLLIASDGSSVALAGGQGQIWDLVQMQPDT